MELKLNGKTYKTGTITFGIFRKGTEYLKGLQNQTFLGPEYPLSELDEAVDFIILVYGNNFTTEEFYNGFNMVDSTDFMAFFGSILSNIQMTEEKRHFLAEKAQQEQQGQETK